MVLLRILRIRNIKVLCISARKWQRSQVAAFQMGADIVRQNKEVTKKDKKIIQWAIGSVFKQISAVLSEVLQFASDDLEVPELSSENFDVFVASQKRAFVMWYDPLCPVCRKSYIQFETFYQQQKGSLACGAINAVENEGLAMRHNINAFPTFRLYVCNGRCSYKSHEGGLKVSEMESFVSFAALDDSELNLMANPRDKSTEHLSAQTVIHSIKPITPHFNFPHANHLNNIYDLFISAWPLRQARKSAPYSLASFSVANLPRSIKVGKANLVITRNVMEVNGANFKEKIKSFDSVLVYFYTTWCTTCSKSLDQFIKAADQVTEDVGVLAMCNGEESLEIVDKYYVGRIPTLKYFRKGRYVTDYIGDIKTELLVKFMKEPHIDEEFIMTVTKHKPHGDLYTSEVFTPTQKKTLWQGQEELIVEVTNENVESVIKQNSSLLMLFYACWNRLCVGLKHDYLTVAKAVEKSDVVLAACDCEEHVEVADRFLIIKFPTIKYLKNGTVVRDFNGQWHADSILEFLKDPSKLQVVAKDERRPSPLQLEDEGIPAYWKGVEGGDKIVHFTDFNFNKLMEKNPSVLIMFYVTWCKSCTPLKREIGKAAIQLSKEIGALASCDAERNNEMADRFSIIKLPTMKYFKNGTYVMDYTGRRTAGDIMDFLKNPRAMKELPTAEIKKPIHQEIKKGSGENVK